MTKQVKPLCQFAVRKNLANWILPHIPEHETYVETCSNTVEVLLAKPPSKVEVYNDLDKQVVNFYRVCRDRPQELAAMLALTPFSNSERSDCHRYYDQVSDELERARQFATLTVQTRTRAWGGTWGRVTKYSRPGRPPSISRWIKLPMNVLNIAERLSEVQIECKPTRLVIREYDSANTLFVLDPLYSPETPDKLFFSAPMSEDDHRQLLISARQIEGKAIICGYDNALYNRILSGWRSVRRDAHQAACDGRGKRVSQDVLWMNY